MNTNERIMKRNGEVVMQEYENGGNVIAPVGKIDPKKPVTKVKGEKWSLDLKDWDYENFSIVQFLPDDTIFETTEFKTNFFVNQIKEYAYLTAGIRFEIIDHRNNIHENYYFEGGIKSYLKSINRHRQAVHPNIFYASKNVDDVEVEIALQYNNTFNETVLCFANHLKNIEGGTHLTGFRSALTKTVNDYARKNNLLRDKDQNLSGNDLREGLTAIISVRLESENLQFEGQTKAKLGNTVARSSVDSVVKETLDTFLVENPKDARAIIDKNVLAFKARVAAKAARDTVIRKSAINAGGGVLPGKLSDCSTKDPKKAELFIVEGDSAGGSAKQGRNRKTQAILPLFGKVLNTERARLDKIVESDKFKSLIVAIGCSIGEHYNTEKLRYHKIIIMADADSDGMHIMALYLTFFYRHLKELIELEECSFGFIRDDFLFFKATLSTF